MNTYEKTTNGVTVTVEPIYMEDQSAPEERHYVWAYHVTIANHGEETVQLLSRYWKITDANGITEEVEGDGVVGEQPSLAPGESYQYTSGAPLSTPTGFMVGNYYMQNPRGETLTIDIPAFSLDSPHLNSMIH